MYSSANPQVSGFKFQLPRGIWQIASGLTTLNSEQMLHPQLSDFKFASPSTPSLRQVSLRAGFRRAVEWHLANKEWLKESNL